MENGIFRPEVLLAALGFFIASSGVFGLAVFILRRKRQDLSLLAFGTAALLYGLRFLVELQIERYTESPPPQILISFVAIFTCVMPVPLSGFLFLLFGSGWKKTMLWVFRISILFAAAGILSDWVQGTPQSLMRLNNVLVTAWAVLTTAHVFWPGLKKTSELRIVFHQDGSQGRLALRTLKYFELGIYQQSD